MIFDLFVLDTFLLLCTKCFILNIWRFISYQVYKINLHLLIILFVKSISAEN